MAWVATRLAKTTASEAIALIDLGATYCAGECGRDGSPAGVLANTVRHSRPQKMLAGSSSRRSGRCALKSRFDDT